MIKKQGCGPCKMYEPRIKEVAKKNQREYIKKSIKAKKIHQKKYLY